MLRIPALACGAALALALVVAATRAGADLDVARALDCSPHGGGGYAHATSSAYRLYGDLTLECWVKAAPTQPLSPYPVIVDKPAANVLNGDATFAFVIQRSNGNAYFRVTTTGGQCNATWTGNLLDGTWHHLAGVRSTATHDLRFYVDGTLVSTVACNGNDSTSAYDLDFGAIVANGYSGNRLIGEIDDVRVWNVARTASQVSTSRFHEFNWAPGLVSEWHFDVAHTVADTSGSPVLVVNDATPQPRAAAVLEGDVALDPSDAPIGRGVAMEPLEVYGRGGYPDPASWACLAPGPDSTWLTIENHGIPGVMDGNGLTGWAALDALGEANGFFGVEGSVSLADGANALMTSGPRGWVGWVIPGIVLLGGSLPSGTMDLDLSDVTTPWVVADTLPPFPSVRLIADPRHANQGYRIEAGSSGGLIPHPVQALTLTDLTTPGAYHNVATIDLSSLAFPVSDVTATGDVLYLAFPDSVREYQRIYVGVNQQQFLQRRPAAIGITDAGTPRGAALASDAGHLYVAGIGGATIFRVFDISNPDQPTPIRGITIEDDEPQAMVVSGGYAYVAGPNGVQAVDVSEPQHIVWAGNWCPDAPPLGMPPLWADGRKVVLADGEAGVYVLSNDAVSTTAVDEPAPGSPVAGLAGWPNPTRGAVSLRYTLPRDGETTLELFDVTGRLLRRVSEHASAGSHMWIWDGRDDSGRRVGAGVYLARLEGAGARLTLRLVELGGS